ncbi:hypothetical protein NLU13_6316 [Sarocladium strictum]|uniref:Mitotic apparatus protein p62 n=1 Tax=Sarocladium strictum TaxID=5046 RepID=A0AA39GG05_SARSR|nr:hypothetical protein NLU13_6316 [Sarocladium strictum]
MSVPFKVLKFPCSDGNQVLVQATSKGNHPLDLKLVGTEGSAAYRVTLKQDRIAALRVKNCPVTESEWEEILQALFQLRPPPDIQATAAVEPDTSIALTVRKIIQGTTHRLGSITLNYTESEEIGLFDWCVAAVDASVDGRKALSDVESQKEALEADVKDYKRQLDELIQAKNDDETVLLQKFRDLLNEKKLKIREQQKIIAAASFPDGGPASPEVHDSPPPTRKPAASRAGKRKAAAKDAQDGDETPEAEEMEVNNPIKLEAEDTDPGNTTEGTASTVGDEDDSDDEEPQAPSNARRASPPRPTSKQKSDKPPPPRSLPFNKKKVAAKAASEATSETDSDDDEL